MFYNAVKFKQNIDNWNIKNVKEIRSMFFETKDIPVNDEVSEPFPIKDLLESVNMEVENVDEKNPEIITVDVPVSPINFVEIETQDKSSQTIKLPKKIENTVSNKTKKDFMTYTYRVGNRSQKFFSKENSI